jgi:hypothetical protein
MIERKPLQFIQDIAPFAHKDMLNGWFAIILDVGINFSLVLAT